MTLRAYRYSLLAPTENADLVMDQMRRAHRYRNARVAIDRTRRDTVREAMETDSAMREAHATLRQRAAELGKALEALESEKVETGKLCGSEDARERVTAARAAYKDASQAFFGSLRQATSTSELAIDRAKLSNNALVRAARAESGCYWGSYLRTERAMQASARATLLYDGSGGPEYPRFQPWRGEGSVGVRFQNTWANTPFHRLHEPNPLLIIGRVDPRAWHSAIGPRPMRRENQPQVEHPRHMPHKQGRRTLMRTTLRMCVQTENRKPIFASWPMLMHRPIPDGSLVREACVCVKRIGSQYRWHVVITVEVPDVPKPAPTGRGVVAVNVCWRKLQNGEHRLAVWVGQDGSQGEIRVSERMLGALRKASGIEQVRDIAFNEIRAKLVAWLAGRDLPEWLRRATMSKRNHDTVPTSAQAVAHIASWRSQARLASLVLRWADNRFPGDEEMFGRRPDFGPDKKPIRETGKGLEGWRYHDHHLWDYESFQRRQAHNQRREDYRLIAARLTEQYDGIATIEFDKSKVAREADPETYTSEARAAMDKKARANRHLLGPSRLFEELERSAKARGKPYVEHDPSLKTRSCHKCGHVDEDFDPAETITHTCSGCGSTWDQDVNNCMNVLADHAASPTGTGRRSRRKTPVAGEETSRARARRLNKERKARVEKADLDNSAASS